MRSALFGVRVPLILAFTAGSSFGAVTDPRLSGSLRGPAAELLARELRLPARATLQDGGAIVLSGFEDGHPRYWVTDNVYAADTISTDEVRAGGSLNLNLNGAGVTIGLWDAAGGMVTWHQEFGPGFIQVDNAGIFNDHPTHVAGTLVGRGVNPWAMGMAPGATLRGFDAINNVSEMNSEASGGLRLSNHSYSQVMGWFFDHVDAFGQGRGVWFWLGPAGAQLDPNYGLYNATTRAYDSVMAANPRFIMCLSAGNQRGFAPPQGSQYYYWDQSGPSPCWTQATMGPGAPGPTGPYDCIPGLNTPKNGLVVGNINPLVGGYVSSQNVSLNVNSGTGPTDDGRIKPDLVADGVNVLSSFSFNPQTRALSTNSYGRMTGTSCAAPGVCGSTALLLQYWRQLRPLEADPLSSTWRALLIHTANEAGPASGPDYRFGWGVMNTKAAAQVLGAHAFEGYSLVEEQMIAPDEGSTWTRRVFTGAEQGSFKVTVAWVDPAGTPIVPVTLNNRSPMLVHDLDVRVVNVNTSAEWRPWCLDPDVPTAPAFRADNFADNVEQIAVETGFQPDQEWEVRVTHKGVLTAPQAFSIVVTGAYHSGNGEPPPPPPPPPPPTCGTSDFNGDGDVATDGDIEAFFACLSGACCATCYSGGSDFNGDGDFGTDADIEAFFRILAGGSC